MFESNHLKYLNYFKFYGKILWRKNSTFVKMLLHFLYELIKERFFEDDLTSITLKNYTNNCTIEGKFWNLNKIL